MPYSRHSRIDRPLALAWRQMPAPLRLGSVVQRLPLPLLDHCPRAARNQWRAREGSCPGISRIVLLAWPEIDCARLSPDQTILFGLTRLVACRNRPTPGRRPSVIGCRSDPDSQVILHAVVRVGGSDFPVGRELASSIDGAGPDVTRSRLAAAGVCAHDSTLAMR